MSDKHASLETRLADAQSPYDKLVAMTDLAWELRYHDPQRSKSLIKEALERVDSADLEIVERHNIIANVDRNNAHFDYLDSAFSEAIAHAGAALGIYESTYQLTNQIRTLSTLSVVYMQLGDFSAALQHGIRQLEISEALEDQASIVNGLNRIGVIYSLMGNYEQALEQYALCLPFYEANNDLNGQARIYNNCLIEYQNLEQHDKALEAGLKSLTLFKAADNLFGRSRIHGNLVRLYTKLDDYENAVQHGDLALSLADQLDNKEHIMVTSLYVGQMHSAIGNFDQAVTYIQTALSIAEETQSRTYQYECHQSLAAVYKNAEDFQRALFHYETFHTLKEAVFDEENTTKIRNLEVSFRTRAAQYEAEMYRHRNAELEALRQQDRVYFERLSEMKDELLRTASHDLKSPLSTLSMLVFALKANPSLDDDGLALAGQIDHQIERMREFVISVLDLAKLETGRAMSIEPLPMVRYVASIVQDYQPLAAKKQISLQFESGEEEIVAKFDPSQIRRVIENLLANAIKFTPPNGEIFVSLGATDKAIIAVSDNGIGIPSDAIPHVFDRFYRVEGETHRSVDGSGLGLAIAKAIVEQHDGEIWVESVIGQGTTFKVGLPLAHELSLDTV